jgi:hypothetical protein
MRNAMDAVFVRGPHTTQSELQQYKDFLTGWGVTDSELKFLGLNGTDPSLMVKLTKGV